jgi:hypothetical protein
MGSSDIQILACPKSLDGFFASGCVFIYIVRILPIFVFGCPNVKILFWSVSVSVNESIHFHIWMSKCETIIQVSKCTHPSSYLIVQMLKYIY